MKTSRLCRRLAALGLTVLIALPAWSFSWPFGFNPEKEAAALVQRFEEGDDLKPLLEDYIEFEDRLEEEISSVRAKYEKKLASIEKEGEKLQEKARKADDLDDLDKLFRKDQELLDEKRQVEEEMDDEIGELNSYSISGYYIIELAKERYITDAESAWQVASTLSEVFGRSGAEIMLEVPALEGYEKYETYTTWSGIVGTRHTRLVASYPSGGYSSTINSEELESRTVDLVESSQFITDKFGGRVVEYRRADGSPVSDPSAVTLETPYDDSFILVLEKDIAFDSNGVDGTDEVSTLTFPFGEDVVFPDLQPQDGRIFVGWCSVEEPDDDDPIYAAGQSDLSVNDVDPGTAFYAQYVSFDVTPVINDLDGNGDGIAQSGEKLVVFPAITNTGSVACDLSFAIPAHQGQGYSFSRQGSPDGSVTDLEPGESVLVSSSRSYTSMKGVDGINTNSLVNYKVKDNAYKVTIARSATNSITIPVEITVEGKTVTKDMVLPVRQTRFETILSNLKIGDEDGGNDNGKANAGETVGLDFVLNLTSSSDDVNGVSVRLTTDSPYVTVLRSGMSIGDMEKGKYYTGGHVYSGRPSGSQIKPDRDGALKIRIADDAPSGEAIELTVTVRDQTGSSHQHIITVPVSTVDASLRLRSWKLREVDANADDSFNPGETYALGYNIINEGPDRITDATLTFSCDDEGVILGNRTVRIDSLSKNRSVMPGYIDSSGNATNESRKEALTITLPSSYDSSKPLRIRWNVDCTSAPEGGWTGLVTIPVEEPKTSLAMRDYAFYETDGDGDGKIEPGERFSVDFVVQNDGECQLKNIKWSFKAGSDDVSLSRPQTGSKNTISKGSLMRGSNGGTSSGNISPSKASDVRFTLSADHVAGSTSTVIVTFTDGISEWEFPMSARF